MAMVQPENEKKNDLGQEEGQFELVENGNQPDDPNPKKDDEKKDVGDENQTPHGTNAISQFLGRLGLLETDAEIRQAPKLSYLALFQKFLWFGARAFGGPFSQIQMMKQELVLDEKWVDVDRFIRVFAVYQALPGPEATELACYFGYLSRGRIGSIIGGLGFVLPGYCGMLLLSYLYDKYGLENKHVLASFHTVQITTCAMVFRAAFKLGESALMNATKTDLNWNAGLLCLFCFLTSILRLNFFIALASSGVMNTIFEYANEHKQPWIYLLGYLFGAGTIGFYGLYVSIHGVPEGSMIGDDASVSGTSNADLFELGLIAGMVTFGGAYTTLPFIYAAAVTSGQWLTEQQFLDAIAITNMMPTPLVTFVTLVGWIGNGLSGAIVIAIGIFLPAFSFTLIGHKFFEKLIDNHYVHPFLDGIGASVIGLLLYTSFQFLRATVETGLECAVFLLSIGGIFYFSNKYTQPIILIISAMAGQILNMYEEEE